MHRKWRWAAFLARFGWGGLRLIPAWESPDPLPVQGPSSRDSCKKHSDYKGLDQQPIYICIPQKSQVKLEVASEGASISTCCWRPWSIDSEKHQKKQEISWTQTYARPAVLASTNVAPNGGKTYLRTSRTVISSVAWVANQSWICSGSSCWPGIPPICLWICKSNTFLWALH